MNFDNKKIMPRFFVVIVLMSLGGLYILGNAAYLMFVESEYWTQVSRKLVKENVPIPAKRGNILSADGQIMASSLPEYKIYMDYVASDKNPETAKELQAWRDSVLIADLDSISQGLSKIFPDKTAGYFKKRLKKGKKLRRRNWQIYGRRISYIQYKECKKLPLFRESPFKGGFYAEEFNQRKKPYGSLATRTLGALYASKDSARYGLELSYDSILRGKEGISHRAKVRNKWLSLVDAPPVDGNDIETTIDVSMQDAAEKALLKQLKNINGDVGVVVLMEVATGDVKAIVNMTKCADGEYREVKNNAVSDLMEPGSTFKTASIMVALEDGKISKNDFVDTGNGQWEMHGRVMKDHNWRRGGYGRISVPEVLMYSSNIGVSRLIDDNYKDHPEKFVDGLYREGVGIPLNIPLMGSGEPRVRRPKKDGSNWSKTALPWMSIGYETQMPPIATLTFYNAIANNGVMIRPKFVKAAVKDGEVIEEYPTEVINPKICSDRTLTQIRDILEKVVSQGLAKPAGSKQFSVAGKTGTAQVSQGTAGYKNGRVNYLVSFCGYFPADVPKYSCIVSIQKPGLPASGGLMAGSVFGKIAERVYAKNLRFDIRSAIDSTSNVIPPVKAGEMNEAFQVLNSLKVPVQKQFTSKKGQEVWGHTQAAPNAVVLQGKDGANPDLVPSVIGMGAKDAVYLLESKGLKVRLNGIGKVRNQSIPGGNRVVKGQTVTLALH